MKQQKDLDIDLPATQTKAESTPDAEGTQKKPKKTLSAEIQPPKDSPASPEANPSDTESVVPKTIERYLVEEEIARGGMGIVVRAYDPDFDRRLALKILLPDSSHSDKLEDRFLEEAKLTGQLEHPGIPPVHEIGLLEDGRPFFAMKLIEGETLEQLLRQRKDPSTANPTSADKASPLDPMRFVSIFEQICLSLGYAHARNVIHRDLKPSNVMVGRFGEVQLMDWGLAKRLKPTRDESPSEPNNLVPTNEVASNTSQPPDASRDENQEEPVVDLPTTDQKPSDHPNTEEKTQTFITDSSENHTRTQAGSILGTPSYMAPEQARGQIDELDTRTDVFGLGAILCAMLTGEPPYQHQAEENTLTRAAKASLQDAWKRFAECGADKELIELAQRCLSPVKQQRPKDAGEVAEAIRTYRSQLQEKLKKAEVHRAQAEVKVAESRKRQSITIALMGSVLMLFAVLVAVGYWRQSVHAEEKQRQEADKRAALVRSQKEREAFATELTDVYRLIDKQLWGEAQQQLGQAKQRLPEGTPEMKAQWRQAAGDVRLAQREEQQRNRQARANENRQAFETELASIYRLADKHLWDEARGQLDQAQQRLNDETPKLTAKWNQAALDIEFAEALDTASFGKSPLTISGKTLFPDPEIRYEQVFLQPNRLKHHDPQKLAQQVRASAIRQHIVEGLDTWASVTKDPKRRKWLHEITRLSDPGKWKNKLRQPNVWTNRKALEHLAKQVDPRNQSPHLLFMLAWRLQTVGADPMPLLRQAQHHHPTHFRLNFMLGTSLLGKDNKEAVGFFRVALATRPNSSAVYNHLGIALHSLGSYEEALACYQKALARRPAAGYRSNLGITLLALGKKQQALEQFQQAIKQSPLLYLPYYHVGQWYSDQNDHDQAIEWYHKALKRKPDHANSLSNLGIAWSIKGDQIKAVDYAKKAIAANPQYAEPYNSVALYLQDKGQLEAAIAHYRKAIHRKPNFYHALTNLGTALVDVKEYQQAIEAQQKAVALRPTTPLAHYNLGLAYLESQFHDKAIEAFRKVVALNRRDSGGFRNLGVAYFRNGQIDLAILAFQKVVRLEPKSSPAHNALGLAYLEKGRYAHAARAFEQASRLTSNPQDKLKSQNLHQLANRYLDYQELLNKHEPTTPWDLKPNQALALATFCLVNEQRYATAAELFHLAFTKQPKLATTSTPAHRYNAACAAVLACSGKGKDFSLIKEKERPIWRRRALTWLEGELKSCVTILAKPSDQAVHLAKKRLQLFLTDSDLASVRDETQLETYEEAEQRAWQDLWREVNDKLKELR
ncbi:MAG: tetratricopeptide repeat protein [Gemmataceae bacterium]